MSVTTARPGSNPGLALLAWRRIQVLVGLTGPTGTIEAEFLRLRHSGGHHEAAPAGWNVDGALTVVRFNVMLGPGAKPFANGDWTLVTHRPGAEAMPVHVTVRDGIASEVPVLFRMEEGDFHARAAVAADGQLVLAVRLVPTKGGHALAGADEASAGPDDGGADDDTADDAGPDAASGGRSGLAGRVASLVVRVARKVRRRARRSARAVRSRMFRATIEVATSLPRRGKPVILFTSDSRAALGGNLELIHDRMLERGVHKRYRIKTIFRPATTLHRPFRDRIRLPLLLGRADIIIIDDYQPAIYWVPVRRHRIVQVWHAVGAFKMVGYSRVGRPGAPTPFARTHKNYSLVTVSAATDIEVYAEAFGISEASVRATGVPRVDRFFDPEYALRARELALAAHPQIEGKRTILFAPTFRGNGVRSATYDMGHLDLAAVHALCVEKDAIFIIRLHPFVGERPVIPAGLTDRIIDGSQAGIDINDLLFSVDLLITDYSSVIYEYSTFGRPALFYAWDLEEYVASRDFYEPYETFVPGRIVRTCEELVDAIQREDYDVDRMAGFAARHFEHHDAGSTDRVLDAILGG